MRRRNFIAGLASTTATWPLAVRAQQTAVPVIGYLQGGSAAADFRLAASISAFEGKADMRRASCDVCFDPKWTCLIAFSLLHIAAAERIAALSANFG